MTAGEKSIFFLNIGHFYTHLLTMIFANVAALSLSDNFGMGYEELITYATPGLFAYGIGMIPAGWLADKWSREWMMVIFFWGIGISTLLTALATTPVQIGGGLLAIGVFAAIYHPVGLAMLVESREKAGYTLAVNGVYGNMGIAVASLVSAFFIARFNWQSAFFVPGAVVVLTALWYTKYILANRPDTGVKQTKIGVEASDHNVRVPFRSIRAVRIFSFLLLTSAMSGLLFVSMTFALPKIFSERLASLVVESDDVGQYVFIVFTAAAFAQLVIGYVLDRFSVKATFAVITALQTLSLFFLHDAFGVHALLIALFLMMIIFGQIPINDVLISQVVPTQWRGRAFAVRNTVNNIVAPLSVFLIAWVYNAADFAALILALAVLAFCSLLCTLFLPKLFQR